MMNTKRGSRFVLNFRQNWRRWCLMPKFYGLFWRTNCIWSLLSFKYIFLARKKEKIGRKKLLQPSKRLPKNSVSKFTTWVFSLAIKNAESSLNINPPIFRSGSDLSLYLGNSSSQTWTLVWQIPWKSSIFTLFSFACWGKDHFILWSEACLSMEYAASLYMSEEIKEWELLLKM